MPVGCWYFICRYHYVHKYLINNLLILYYHVLIKNKKTIIILSIHTKSLHVNNFILFFNKINDNNNK
jgi:hypothetical protein